MSVGDVASDARGTGARFNDGKAPLELLPLRIFAESIARRQELTPSQRGALEALQALARWQETGEVGQLYDAIHALDHAWDECAAVLDYGRRKYAAWNWSKGMPWSVCVGCAARHLRAMIQGEDLDCGPKGSNLPHRGHAMCNLVFLITYHHTYPEGDDRPRTLAPV